MLNRRMQLLLDDERYARVAREAQRRGTSMGNVVRDAMDRLPADTDARRAAVDAILAAEPMPLPNDPRALRRELDAAGRAPSGVGRM